MSKNHIRVRSNMGKSQILIIVLKYANKSTLSKKECPICYNKFINSIKPESLPCKHILCSNCLNEWLNHNKHTCPMCRASF